MKNTLFYTLVISGIILLVGACNNSEVKKNEESLAIDVCACAKKSIDLNKELEKISKSGDNIQMRNRMEEAEELFDAMMDCIDKKMITYDPSKLERGKLSLAIKKACSDMPEAMVDDILREVLE